MELQNKFTKSFKLEAQSVVGNCTALFPLSVLFPGRENSFFPLLLLLTSRLGYTVPCPVPDTEKGN